jgi:hypothetical protein
MKHCTRAALFAAALVTAGTANAATMTFDSLAGSNGDPFTGPYVEDGFSIVKTVGDFYVGAVFGNPVPSLVTGSVFGGTSGALTLTKVGGGTFTLTSFDYTNFGGPGSYSVVGSLNGSGVYVFGASGDFSAVWQTVLGNGTSVDQLDFTFSARGTSLNIDNFTLGSGGVPEPASWALMIVGFGLVGVASRRRVAAVTA